MPHLILSISQENSKKDEKIDLTKNLRTKCTPISLKLEIRGMSKERRSRLPLHNHATHSHTPLRVDESAQSLACLMSRSSMDNRKGRKRPHTDHTSNLDNHKSSSNLRSSSQFNSSHDNKSPSYSPGSSLRPCTLSTYRYLSLRRHQGKLRSRFYLCTGSRTRGCKARGSPHPTGILTTSIITVTTTIRSMSRLTLKTSLQTRENHTRFQCRRTGKFCRSRKLSIVSTDRARSCCRRSWRRRSKGHEWLSTQKWLVASIKTPL